MDVRSCMGSGSVRVSIGRRNEVNRQKREQPVVIDLNRVMKIAHHSKQSHPSIATALAAAEASKNSANAEP